MPADFELLQEEVPQVDAHRLVVGLVDEGVHKEEDRVLGVSDGNAKWERRAEGKGRGGIGGGGGGTSISGSLALTRLRSMLSSDF